MKTTRWYPYGLIVFLFIGVAPRAQAQFAVIDVSALAQLIQQVQTLNQTLSAARGQLTQAQQEFQTITGTRGMQNLLSGTVRNYLPTNIADLTSALSQVNSGFSSLATAIQVAAQANAVLTPQQLGNLPSDQQARISAWRSSIAMLQGITSSALANSSSRFSALQQLISAIGGAADQKAALDLQARIVMHRRGAAPLAPKDLLGLRGADDDAEDYVAILRHHRRGSASRCACLRARAHDSWWCNFCRRS